MDDLNCSGEVVYQTLREIEFINKTLGGNYVTLHGLNQLLNGQNGHYHLADLGCGGGEMLKVIADWGVKKGYHFRLTGFDANPNIIAFARKVVHQDNIEFITENVEDKTFLERRFDIISATLFIHHLTSQQISHLLKKWLEQVTVGIVINDLHRHPAAYFSIKLLTQLFSRSAMVRYDAPLSVLRGFTKKEWIDILSDAGIENYVLKWKWAFRWEVVIRK